MSEQKKPDEGNQLFKAFMAGVTQGAESAKVGFMAGSEPDSIFMVIGEHSGLRVGIRPLLFNREVSVSPTKKVNALCVGYRLRAETCSPNGLTSLAADSLGLPFSDKGTHASVAGMSAVINYPANGARILQVMKESDVVKKLVQHVLDTLTNKGCTPSQPIDKICEFMNAHFDSIIIDNPEILFDFDVCFVAS